MKLSKYIPYVQLAAILLLTPMAASAEASSSLNEFRDTGVSGLWILANISYAGMRAQNNPTIIWRVLSFIFGFPGTLLSMICIDEGSNRAYGINLPNESGQKEQMRETPQ